MSATFNVILRTVHRMSLVPRPSLNNETAALPIPKQSSIVSRYIGIKSGNALNSSTETTEHHPSHR